MQRMSPQAQAWVAATYTCPDSRPRYWMSPGLHNFHKTAWANPLDKSLNPPPLLSLLGSLLTSRMFKPSLLGLSLTQAFAQWGAFAPGTGLSQQNVVERALNTESESKGSRHSEIWLAFVIQNCSEPCDRNLPPVHRNHTDSASFLGLVESNCVFKHPGWCLQTQVMDKERKVETMSARYQ